MAYLKERHKLPDWIGRECSVTLIFWLVVFLAAAIMEIIG
jgi:hypothetical protein